MNKTDKPGDLFDVTIFLQKQGMLIKASGVTNTADYFEIKVKGLEALAKLQSQFNYRYSAMVKCLRIMFDALVLMNPEKLAGQSAASNSHTAGLGAFRNS